MHQVRWGSATLLLLMVAGACAATAGTPRGELRIATPSPGASPTPSAVLPAAPAGSAPRALPPAPAPEGPTPFHVAAILPDGEVHVPPVLGKTFFLVGHAAIAELEGEEVRLVPERHDGLEPGFDIASDASVVTIVTPRAVSATASAAIAVGRSESSAASQSTIAGLRR